MIEEGAQNLLEAADLRCPTIDQNVHIKVEPRLQIRLTEQRFHQDRRIHGARARLQDDPDVFGTLVAHIGENRDLLGRHDLRDLLDQFGLLDLKGDLSHDDLPLAAA